MGRTKSAESIPIYALYGESLDAEIPAGIHIEEIGERSRGKNWMIKPHRHGTLFQVLCIFRGRASIELDELTCDIGDDSMVTIPVGIVHGFSFSPETQGYVITLSQETQDVITQLQSGEYLRPVFEAAAVVDMAHKDELRQQLKSCIAQMRYEFTTANEARSTSLLLLANLLVLNIKRLLDANALERTPRESHLRTLDAFRRLLERNFRQHWQVGDYASELNVSTSTLNRMCRKRFGASAKSLITSRLISEAKRRLVYTRQPVDQIAYHLGYKDPAYFSRVFKNQERLSPGEYRKRQQL